MNIFRKKKIFFIYFSFKGLDYTPLDVGYILAIIKKNKKANYNIELLEHIISDNSESNIQELISRQVRYIASQKPQAIFFFLDNVLWSKTYALERARKITLEINRKYPRIYIGAQSYKFDTDQIKKIFSYRIFNCLVGNNPEYSFRFLDKIIDMKPVAGVIYCHKHSDMKNFVHFSGPASSIDQKNLDFIPSPYLTHILDNFLVKKQKERSDNFISFLYSSRGCKFGCYYCARSVKFEKVSFFSAKRFYDEIEYIFNNFGIFRFFVLDDAFLFSASRLRDFLFEFDNRKEKNRRLTQIRLIITARIESLDEKTISMLKKINVVWIQIGLQTINPKLQHYMRRAISFDKFKENAVLLKKYGIKSLIDIIVGLPDDSVEYFQKTLDFALELEPGAIQIKQFYFSPGTLFYLEREKYVIETSSFTTDYNLPCVSSTIGEVGKKYYAESSKYIRSAMRKHPEVRWKIITELDYIGNQLNFDL